MQVSVAPLLAEIRLLVGFGGKDSIELRGATLLAPAVKHFLAPSLFTHHNACEISRRL